MTLYQRVRPQSFEDMVGDRRQIEALNDLIVSDNPPHVFLFIGPSGCGKTTAARISAKALGADDLAIIEINSANNRGIETARHLQDQMRFPPTMGEVTVYIIDELHMTTKEWQNAMLKPLEDTPSHVFYFLCTTDPHKLAKPLRTRCHEVSFGSLSPEDLVYLLRKANRQESLGVGKGAIEEIAEEVGGSARKALILLERVAVVEDEDERLKLIRGGVLEEDEAETIELCRALLNTQIGWASVAKMLKTLKQAASDPERARYAVLGYMNSVLLGGKQNARAALALEFFSEPFYNSGKAGLTLACYQTVFSD